MLRHVNSLIKYRMFLVIAVFLASTAGVSWASEAPASPGSGIGARFSEEGGIAGINLSLGEKTRAIKAFTALKGCRKVGEVARTALENGGVAFRSTLEEEASGARCTLEERFIATAESIRWQIEILGEGAPWSAPIETHLIWPKPKKALVWTAWGDTRPKKSLGWCDPLQPAPFSDLQLIYGAKRYDSPQAISIPLVSVLDTRKDEALSLVLSPEDLILDMKLDITAEGGIVFSREKHRISAERPVRFAMDLVAHPADWRGGLGWMARRYPAFFKSPNPAALPMAGCGAYSASDADTIDAESLMKMAFRINWKASFDFPYMGMFIPPVGSDEETWTDFKQQPTSIARMREYSRRMREMGFFTLNYFNVTEFGAHFQYPPPPRKAARPEDLWKDAQDFLYYVLGDAILPGPDGKPIGSWEGCVAMDPGEPFYQSFLLDQAQQHIDAFPESSGICIDRMDWLMFYNAKYDDGVSWVEGKPARSLVTSWHDIMSKLGPMMHRADKVIFCNPHYRRIDLLSHLDGVYDEFGQMPHSLNLCALLCVEKPILAWTVMTDDLRDTPDAYFQRHLHLGAYLTAPIPGNDHTILPDGKIEQYYYDYGPMLDALRGKRWVLSPHAVEVAADAAKANLFSVPGGYVLPVTFGGDAAEVSVLLRGLDALPGESTYQIEALYPGTSAWAPISSKQLGNVLELTVPLQRGCALIRLAYAWLKPDARCFKSQASLEMGTTLKDAEIRYTLDGRQPGPNSERYSGPIAVEGTSKAAMAIFIGDDRIGQILSAEFVRLP